jgi:hypothetical protein
MSWREFAQGSWGEELRLGLLRALERAYDENGQRFAPEDIGDNNKVFGVAVSENSKFLIERDVVAVLDGLEVERPRNAWRLRLWGGVALYVYKAPPGIVDVHQLRFRSSQTKLELIEQNADQLAFTFDEPAVRAAAGRLRHVVVVHFGDPDTGLLRVDVGAPYATALNGCEWEWVECLSALEPFVEETRDEQELGSDVMDDEDFGLEMRDHIDEDQRDESGQS